MIEINYELKDIMICAIRYALGRHTYTCDEFTSYLINHPELIDKRVKTVLLDDLKEIDNYYKNDNDIDKKCFIKLKNYLERWNEDEL